MFFLPIPMFFLLDTLVTVSLYTLNGLVRLNNTVRKGALKIYWGEGRGGEVRGGSCCWGDISVKVLRDSRSALTEVHIISRACSWLMRLLVYLMHYSTLAFIVKWREYSCLRTSKDLSVSCIWISSNLVLRGI